MRRPAAALLVGLFVLFLPLQTAHAQPGPGSVTMQVYDDGTVAVTQVVSANASDTSVSLQLLSPIIANPVVFDQNGSGLYFEITGANITVYTIGATRFTLEYATAALTSKQGAVWSLDFAASYNCTVTLPQQSTLTSVSGTPISIATSNGSPVLVVSPGNWQIGYGLPVSIVFSSTATSSAAVSSSSAASSSARSTLSSSIGASSATSNSTSEGLPPPSSTSASSGSSSGSGTKATSTGGTTYLVAVGGAALLAIASASLYLSRRRSSRLGQQGTELRPDDIKVIEFLSEKGGKVLEPEIRMRFALPKTSAWRQIKRLERLGYVKVTKIGSQNQVELLRRRPGSQPTGP
jgi:uncharacterized membrane protein